MSFRQLIQAQVPYNDWGSLGMDIAIGAVVDVPATPWQFQFLPKYVAEAHAEATISTSEGIQPLIKSDVMLLVQRQPVLRRIKSNGLKATAQELTEIRKCRWKNMWAYWDF